VRFCRDLGPNTLGLCCGVSHVISIRTGQTTQARWATFIHELLHAIEFSFKTEYPHKMIHCLDDKLAAVLFDNWLSAS
jgi:hypothetical protein